MTVKQCRCIVFIEVYMYMYKFKTIDITCAQMLSQIFDKEALKK